MSLMLTALILLFALLIGAVSAYQHWIDIGKLNRRNLLITGLILVMMYGALGMATWLEWLEPVVIEYAAMILYALATGLFVGGGVALLTMRSKAGLPEYAQPHFMTDGLPNFLAVAIVAYGIYRTSMMHPGQLTWLSLTSGLSLVGFGFYGWCIEVLPEFRANGIILLDQYIPWSRVISYRWDSEDILTVEYHPNDKEEAICEFHTSIPPENRRTMEQLIKRKLDEFGKDHPVENEPAQMANSRH
jgi:hypothetical protein